MTPYLKKKIIVNAISWPFLIAAIVGINIGHNYAYAYENNLNGILCPPIENKGAVSQSESSGNAVAVEIESEGMTLVQNRNNVLPLAKDNKRVSVFGVSTVDWFYGGAGSGQIVRTRRDSANLIEALKEYGVSVCDDVVTAMNSYKRSRSTAGGAYNGDYILRYSLPENVSKIYEPKISAYQNAYNAAKAFNNQDTAIVAIGRYSGEAEDLTTVQHTRYETVNERTTLDFSPEEEALVRQVAQDFDKVIVLINSTNAMNLQYIEEIEGVDACIVVGATGCAGARAIPKILWGDVNPSGHLTDTYVYDFKTNPTFWTTGYDNLGIYQNSKIVDSQMGTYYGRPSRGIGGGYCGSTGNTKGDEAHGENYAVYVDCMEGIYVGYRWYETADAEHYWDSTTRNYTYYKKDGGTESKNKTGYDAVVQYPFGYGLSYTNFDWEIDTANLSKENGSTIDADTQIEIPVKVTNKGTKTGKDVVQVYLTAPYTAGGIEKSEVELVGFAKTKDILPGATETVTVKIDTNDFKSFDDYDANNNGFYGYELEAGAYKLTLRTDAHHIKDADHASNYTLTYNVDTTLKLEKDRDTNADVKPLMTRIENKFTPVDGLAVDGSDSGQNISYFHRNSFPTLLTAKPAARSWDAKLEVSKGKEGALKYNCYSKTQADAWDNAVGFDAFGKPIPTSKPQFGTGTSPMLLNGFDLTADGEKAGANYNDPVWDKVLDAVPYNTAVNYVEQGYAYSRPSMSYIGLNQTLSDCDGPAQLNNDQQGGSSSTGYPIGTIIGMTWSEKMAFKYGKSYAQDMIAVGADACYGFGANIHRSPFCGRNFEYFGEDPFLNGIMSKESCRAMQVNGKSTYLKHFTANDIEQWRCGIYTWMTEQAFREIYARPFEIAVKADSTTGIMSALNRIGATWAGGSEAALQGILRNEWGFHGIVKTDYAEDPVIMDFSQAVRAGGTLGLSDSYTWRGDNGTMYGVCGSFPNYANVSPRLAYRLREIVKETMWMYIHTAYLNLEYRRAVEAGEITDDSAAISFPSKQSWIWWQPSLYALEVLIYVGVGVAGYFLIRPLDPDSKSKKEKKEAK